MDFFNSAKFINAEIKREIAVDNRFSHPEYPPVHDSISNIHNQAIANPTIKRTVFLPLSVDQMPYAQSYTTSV